MLLHKNPSESSLILGVNNARPADARSLKWKVAVGRFSNETQYGKGIFYERDNDPMAKPGP